MRFDDSLATVLAGDVATSFGAQSAWRQLVDLVGRRRVPDEADAVERLRGLRAEVPAKVRAASGRALALIQPPAALVALFAEDELATAAPVLRTAALTAPEWLALLPSLTPPARAVLRHRRDLPAEVVRGLASFGATDFVLGHDGAVPPTLPVEPAIGAAPEVAEQCDEVARTETAAVMPEAPRFEIAELVARIDAFRRDRPEPVRAPAPPPPAQFQFHTDAAGVIRWIEGVARGPLIGVSLASSAPQGLARLAPGAADALRTRASFRGVRLDVGGESSAAGTWVLAGIPRFEPASGRFTGIAGTARRPRADEQPQPRSSTSDQLRQLVHELRTPANAISGFSELIGTELLGPVPPVYRERADLIRGEAAGLVAAIDDLDTAARLEGDALELRPAPLDLSPLLARIAAELRPQAVAGGVMLVVQAPAGAMATVDDRQAARLIERLLTVAIAAAAPGERLYANLVVKPRSVRLHVTRPRALAADDGEALLTTAEGGNAAAPLLGIGFTVRLVRELATALGGSLAITPDRLTLRLPAAVTAGMEQAAAAQ